jgi:transposase InsO family protein
MSRRGNCHDNAVTENFSNLKKEKIRCKNTKRVMKQDQMRLTVLRCSIAQSGDIPITNESFQLDYEDLYFLS